MLEFTDALRIEVVSVGAFGQSEVLLHWRGDIAAIFNAVGKPPLPPYIKREAGESDTGRYQTVFAKASKQGSAAAPTAGLHFTPELLDSLMKAGRQWAEVTLYVGYGTFSPVREQDIRNHEMHEEYVELPEGNSRGDCQSQTGGPSGGCRGNHLRTYPGGRVRAVGRNRSLQRPREPVF